MSLQWSFSHDIIVMNNVTATCCSVINRISSLWYIPTSYIHVAASQNRDFTEEKRSWFSLKTYGALSGFLMKINHQDSDVSKTRHQKYRPMALRIIVTSKLKIQLNKASLIKHPRHPIPDLFIKHVMCQKPYLKISSPTYII